MKRLLHALDRHWFAPSDQRNIAAARIVVAAILLFCLLAPPALTFVLGFSSEFAWEKQRWFASLPDYDFTPIPALKLLTVPFGAWGERPGPAFLHVVHWVAVISGFSALLGFWTRASLLALAGTSTLLIAHAYSYAEMHHPEVMPILAVWILALGPAGAAWSVDAVRRRLGQARLTVTFEPVANLDRRDRYARWGLRLIQWLLASAYFSAGIAKFRLGAGEWLSGSTMIGRLARRAMVTGSDLPTLVMQIPLAASVIAWLTVAFELTFFLAILLPRLTLPFLLVGASFHLGIFILLGADFLAWPLLYVVFLDIGGGGPLDPSRRLRARRDWTVIYDGLCPLCIRSMVILDALDIRGRLGFVDLEGEPERLPAAASGLSPEELRHRMHVVSPDGRIFRGFYAFRMLARFLPAVWPLLPLLHLPGVESIGSRVYDHVADRRSRLACRVDTCDR